jgi:hypothetical protein
VIATLYGSGTVIWCPKSAVAPPPDGQVIVIAEAVAGALEVVGAPVGARLVDDAAAALARGVFWAAALVGASWNASRLPISAVASARAPTRTPIRWFRLRFAARA